MPCFYCGKRVSFVRQLSDADFCSEEHRQKYHELTRMALNRLVESREHLAAGAPKRRRAVESAVAAAEPPIPTPPVAELVAARLAGVPVAAHAEFFREFAPVGGAVWMPEVRTPAFAPGAAPGLRGQLLRPGAFGGQLPKASPQAKDGRSLVTGPLCLPDLITAVRFGLRVGPPAVPVAPLPTKGPGVFSPSAETTFRAGEPAAPAFEVAPMAGLTGGGPVGLDPGVLAVHPAGSTCAVDWRIGRASPTILQPIATRRLKPVDFEAGHAEEAPMPAPGETLPLPPPAFRPPPGLAPVLCSAGVRTPPAQLPAPALTWGGARLLPRQSMVIGAPPEGVAAPPAPSASQALGVALPQASALPDADAARELRAKAEASLGATWTAAGRLPVASDRPYEPGTLTQRARSVVEEGWALGRLSWDVTCRKSPLWRLRPAGFEFEHILVPPPRTELASVPEPGVGRIAAPPQAEPPAALEPRAPGLPRASETAGRARLGSGSLLVLEAPPSAGWFESLVARLAASPVFPVGKPRYIGWAAVRLRRALGAARPRALGWTEPLGGSADAQAAPVPGFRVAAWLFTHSPGLPRAAIPAPAAYSTLGEPGVVDCERVCAAGLARVPVAAPSPLLPESAGGPSTARLNLALAGPSPLTTAVLVPGAWTVQALPAAHHAPGPACWRELAAVVAVRQSAAPVRLSVAMPALAGALSAAEGSRGTRPLEGAAAQLVPGAVRKPGTGRRSPLRPITTARERALVTERARSIELPKVEAALSTQAAAFVLPPIPAAHPAPVPRIRAATELSAGPPAEMAAHPAAQQAAPSAIEWAVVVQPPGPGGIQVRFQALGGFVQPSLSAPIPEARAGAGCPEMAAQPRFGWPSPRPPRAAKPAAALLVGSARPAPLRPLEPRPPEDAPLLPRRMAFLPVPAVTRTGEPALRVTGERRLLPADSERLGIEPAGAAGRPQSLRHEVAVQPPALREDVRTRRLRLPVLRSGTAYLPLAWPAAQPLALAFREAPAVSLRGAVRARHRTLAISEACVLSTGSQALIQVAPHGGPGQATGPHVDLAPVMMTGAARLPARTRVARPALAAAALAPGGRAVVVAIQGGTAGQTRAHAWQALGQAQARLETLATEVVPVLWSVVGLGPAEAPQPCSAGPGLPRGTMLAIPTPGAVQPASGGLAKRRPFQWAPPAEPRHEAELDCREAHSIRIEARVPAAPPVPAQLPARVAAPLTGSLQVASPAARDGRSENMPAALRQPPGHLAPLSDIAWPQSGAGAGCAGDLQWPLLADVDPVPLSPLHQPWTQPQEVELPREPRLQARPLAPVPHRFERLPSERSLAPRIGRLRQPRRLPRAMLAPAAVLVFVLVAGLLFWNSGAAASLRDTVRARAAVSLEEDFSSGWGLWQGAAGSWRRDPTGSAEIGSLALLGSSLGMRDYRLEFMGQIERQGLTWVFRARDVQNYYAMRIAVLKPGPLPTVALVRHEVLGGQEGPRVQVPLRVLLHNDTPFRVQLRVSGGDFMTFINGQLVDFWGDDRLREGGVGFVGEQGDRARLYWVKVAHQDDMLGRVCSFLAGSNLDSRNGSAK